MSKRLNLREFQQNLSNRIHAKNSTAGRISTLGVQIAGQYWLVEMTDISEVLPLPPLTYVPLSKPWLRGVANVRGSLYCIADMAGYLGMEATVHDGANRILLVAERHEFNAALLVERVLGLRDATAWLQSGNEGRPEYRDEQGILWRKLDVVGLLGQPEFLQIGV